MFDVDCILKVFISSHLYFYLFTLSFWDFQVLICSGLSIGRSGSDASLRMSPSNKLQAITMSRTNSSPGTFDSLIDRPMRLAEIFVASEHALKRTISNPDLWKSLSSVEEFEVLNSCSFCLKKNRCGVILSLQDPIKN